MMANDELVRPFRELGLGDLAEVGGKNASLGELVRELGGAGVRVPDGFAVTAAAYRAFLRESGLDTGLSELLGGLDADDVADLQRRGRAAREAILGAPMSEALRAEIVASYERLSGDLPGGVDVAVRSSATAEDLPEASFAGQQETFLGVQGSSALLDAVRRCFASLYTDRAISYRAERGYGQLDVALSVGVQRMVRSDLACSGVIFTLDTESGNRDVVLISAAWGLGETVVQGSVVPDEYTVFKPTLRAGKRPIVRRVLGSKEIALRYDEGGGRGTRVVPVGADDRCRFVLTDDEVLELARLACTVEDHYSRRRGGPTPMDLEWAKDGRTGELFVLQARPETVHSQRKPMLERATLRGTGEELVTGRAIGQRIGSGPVRVVRDVSGLSAFRAGEVLVAERTDPDWEPVMRKASAIVTERGGRTCHAAIVSRELGIPAVVGAVGALARLPDGEPVTVVCSEGDLGRVLAGAVPFELEQIEVESLPRPRTKVSINVANPSEAFRLGQLPCDGVGLLRVEFVLGSHVGVHPMALLHPERITDPAVRAEVDRRTSGWPDPATFFVDRLAEGVATIAAAFWPRDVLVRVSDFKTNEYANLLGGAPFEPTEENPMIGFRGASRYAHPRYREAFALECRALRRVRQDMGLVNVKVMVPFVRTVPEARQVVAELASHGLVRGRDGLELWAMCEVPSNVIRIEAFAELFDGFSIGSNDLTQLVLGVDRESEILSDLFDERDPAVLWAIRHAVEGAHAAGRKVGICGQAPSDHPEFAAFLVGCGIDGISLNPDSLVDGLGRIAAAEEAAS
jgi:pyruvate, water dikinase